MEYFKIKNTVKWVEFRDFLFSLGEGFSKDNGVMYGIEGGEVEIYIACGNPAFVLEIAKKYPVMREIPPDFSSRFVSINPQFGFLGDQEFFNF